MNRLRMPDVSAEHMPVLATAQMRELRAEINRLKAQMQSQIDVLEAEYQRLRYLEQLKVKAEYEKRVIARARKTLVHPFSDAEILAMAEEIKAGTTSFAERALVAAYFDCHKKNKKARHD